jgi:GTP 3',8-cyclase
VPLADVLNGIEYALEANYKSIKVNMVVQKGINHKDILPMARHFRHSGVILRFIEFMDVGNHNDWSLDQVFTAGEIVNLIDKEFPLEPVEANYHGEVAKRWKYVDGGGELGVISSITQPFCGGCARARLSAVGELYTCLFATAGFDLRSLVRAGHDDETISQRIAQIWRQREDRYSEIRFTKDNKLTESSARQKVEMSYIGG